MSLLIALIGKDEVSPMCSYQQRCQLRFGAAHEEFDGQSGWR
jgi:hypothetical protein